MYPSPAPVGPPMGKPLGTMFGEALQLLRRHMAVFAKIAALQVLPQLIFAIYLQASGLAARFSTQVQDLVNTFQSKLEASGGTDTSFVNQFPWGLPTDAISTFLLWSMAALFIYFFVFRTIAMGASVIAVGDIYRTSDPSAGRSLRGAFAQFGALFSWAMLSALVFFGSILLLLIPCLGIFIWSGALLFLSMRLAFVPQIIVAEDANVFTAMGRSWELTKGAFWRMVGAWILFVALINIATTLVSTLIISVLSAIAGAESAFTVAANQGITKFLALLTIPIGYIGFTLLYYDQVRRATMPPPQPPQFPTYTPYQ